MNFELYFFLNIAAVQRGRSHQTTPSTISSSTVGCSSFSNANHTSFPLHDVQTGGIIDHHHHNHHQPHPSSLSQGYHHHHCVPGTTATAYPLSTGFISMLMRAEPYPYPSPSPARYVDPGGGTGAGMDGLCETAARLLFSAVEWAKNIPFFPDLQLCDQVTLLRFGWSELFLLNASQSAVPIHASPLLTATSGSGPLPVLVDQIRVFQDQVEKLRTMRVDSAEYSCLKAIVLFSSGTV